MKVLMYSMNDQEPSFNPTVSVEKISYFPWKPFVSLPEGAQKQVKSVWAKDLVLQEHFIPTDVLTVNASDPTADAILTCLADAISDCLFEDGDPSEVVVDPEKPDRVESAVAFEWVKQLGPQLIVAGKHNKTSDEQYQRARNIIILKANELLAEKGIASMPSIGIPQR